MPQFTTVESIAVHVATGDTLHPSENGFAALWAEIPTTDPALKQRLVQSELQGDTVHLRCAMVDVIGKVTKHDEAGDESLFVVAVADLIYRNPANAAHGA